MKTRTRFPFGIEEEASFVILTSVSTGLALTAFVTHLVTVFDVSWFTWTMQAVWIAVCALLIAMHGWSNVWVLIAAPFVFANFLARLVII